MSDGLNTAQQEAVNYLHGPCLVLAGAGSGKTRVIIHKISRLIQSGISPKSIVAITFTNKAALEMRERAKNLIGRLAKDVIICTFHAMGVRMLRRDGEAIGLKANFSILDTDDVINILKEASATTDIQLARSWQWKISSWKNAGLNAKTALTQALNENERLIAQIMSRYEERLSAYQCVDFDDLVGLPHKLLSFHGEIRAKWQEEIHHILVDEYQDTNVTQYEFLKLLAGKKQRITAVGDDDQSIYGWRGATLENLKKLSADYANLKIIKLEQNYRSTTAILNAANNVIQANPKLFPKTLFSELGQGEPVSVVESDNEEHEAERMVARIQSLIAIPRKDMNGQAKCPDFRDFAILYRANHQSRILEQTFRKAQIPYKVSGGQSFFDKSEIKDLCAWLRLWVNNDDDPAFLRAITTPKRRIGHQSLQSLGKFANQYRVSLFEALFSQSLSSVISSKILAGFHEFGREINDLAFRAKQTKGFEEAKIFLLDWLKGIAYEKYLFDSEDDERVAAGKWNNVLEFCEWISNRCGGQIEDVAGVRSTQDIKNLLEVVQTVSLISSLSERDSDQNVVTLSTLHAAKGLEWPHVMLVGINEDLLPFKPSSKEKQDAEIGEVVEETTDKFFINSQELIQTQRIEEERRLMYVGITRAQFSLVVSWCKKRKKGRDIITALPSRFIAEMALNREKIIENPLEKLRALRAELALRVGQNAIS
jgi:ATP-dependent DNA helicase Rep